MIPQHVKCSLRLRAAPARRPGPMIQCSEMSVGCPSYVHTLIINLKCDRTATSLILLRHNEEVNDQDAEVEDATKDGATPTTRSLTKCHVVG